MRTAAILMALVVVLGTGEAGAQVTQLNDYTITVEGNDFGLIDEAPCGNTLLMIGPFGEYPVPFTATQGLIGFCVIVVGMVILSLVAVVGWKRKRAPHQQL